MHNIEELKDEELEKISGGESSFTDQLGDFKVGFWYINYNISDCILELIQYCLIQIMGQVQFILLDISRIEPQIKLGIMSQ